jgi:mRNA interferase MazF
MVRRGEIYYANLNPVLGSEQGGLRPVLIIQNDIGNTYSPTTIIAAITSRIKRAKLPTHIEISAERFHLEKDSVILLEQLRTIDKQRLKERITFLDEATMRQVNEALEISLGLRESR